MASFAQPIRTVSSATLGSLGSITPSAPMGAASMAMNARAGHNDSLYYVCLTLMHRLAKVPGMKPYLDLAYALADENAEKQAMALAAALRADQGNGTAGNAGSQAPGSGSQAASGVNNGSANSTNGISGDVVPIVSDISRNGSVVNLPATIAGDRRSSAVSTVSSTSSEGLQGHWSSTLFTFAAGVLPEGMTHDPVTPVWNLFQQGAPLCLIFNAICPENTIDVVSSDDLKVCKMSVYQFLSACKLHLNVRDDELFAITSVFSDDIRNLLEVIHSVNLVLDLDPRFDVEPVNDQVLAGDDERSKIVKELVESERKYVYDLKTLAQYRDELSRKELISLDDINMLFPNLNEIVDFQRRLLVGLECSAAAGRDASGNSTDGDDQTVKDGATKSKSAGKVKSGTKSGNADDSINSQRIGLVFVHAGVQGFQIYEAWSLFQNSAIEFITKEAEALQQSSSLIGSPYELQSFLIKPIQRLCKYPLLLKSLLKRTDPSYPHYAELQTAYAIMRRVGATINEAQRKSENMQLIKKLQEQVVDWKGYSLNGVGELLYANVVTVKDLLNDGHSGEKEVHCYLFERVIYFFKEHKEKGSFLSGHKSGRSSSSLSHRARRKPARLALNGIIYISKIYKVTTSDTSPYFSSSLGSTQPGHFLTLRWRGNRDTGGCVFHFRSEEHMNQWDAAIRRLSGADLTDYSADSATMVGPGFRSASIDGSYYPAKPHTVSGNFGGQFSAYSSQQSSSVSLSPYSKKLRSISSPAMYVGRVHANSATDLPPLPQYRDVSSSFSRLSLQTRQLPYDAPPRSAPAAGNTSGGIPLGNTNTGNPSGMAGNSAAALGLHKFNVPAKSPFEDMLRIELVFNQSLDSVHLSVNPDTTYDELVRMLVDKLNHISTEENGNALYKRETIRLKFRDEDGDMIRFQEDADWDIAKDMLTEISDEEQRILQLKVC